jgi:dTDP-4-dehydrorhamnose reductase
MSPTYVPDVVNASLDLLLDGAAGIWHLSNAGDVSWFELVSRAAATCGYDPQRVWRCRGADLGWVAPRPAYSVLGSERGQLLRPTEEALEQFALEWRARSVPQRTAV